VPASRRSFVRRLLAVLVGLVLALVAGEIVMRMLASRAGRPHDSTKERAELERLAQGESQYHPTFRGALPALSEGQQYGASGPEAQALRMLHPFTGWETAPGNEITARLVGADGSAPRDARDFRIVLTGGSVAAIFARLGSQRLVERLAADPRLAGRRIEVLGYGRTGFKQPQQLMMVAWLTALGVVPEVVLNLDGHNEVTVGAENAGRGTHPFYPSIPHWAALALVGGLDRDVIRTAGRALEVRERVTARAQLALRMGLYRTAIGAAWSRRRLAPLQREQGRLYEQFFQALDRSATSGVLRGPPFDADPQRVLTQTVAGWEESSRLLQELCASRGVLYVHALQPALYDPAGKTPTEREIASARVIDEWRRGVVQGYPLLRAAGQRRLDAGEHFVDASDVFVGVEGDVYVDSCHFEERGNEILAERLAAEILRVLP